MSKAMFESATFHPDRLVANNAHLLVARRITLAEGQNLQRGAVLGSADGEEYVLSLAAAEDGSEEPDLILAEDCDASEEDKPAIAYARGDFNENALTLGTGHTADSIREGLRVKGVFLIPAQPA
ncbi:MAG: head decoration protein [Ectothiorhodospiraceae bacterium]|nr:head decoration protein [Ectothiorhodospiraceae bacterium]MCH8502913.1 head decoration protein [Ectothiorhodospiraceae bacterium]